MGSIVWQSVAIITMPACSILRHLFCGYTIRLAIHLSQNMWKRWRNVKNETWIVGYLASLFSCFARLFSLFAFHSVSPQGWHSCEKSKNFVVYFFAALIKHEIRMKYEKCIASVLYFVVCFAKTFKKYSWNAKYESTQPALRVRHCFL